MGYLYRKSLYFYEYEGMYLAYSFLRHVLIIVDEKVYKSVIRGQKSESLERFSNLGEKMCLFEGMKSVTLYNPQIVQAQFSFAPIHDCNLRCKYCFADHGENFCGEERKISTSMVDKILDFVYFKQFSHCKEYRIDFVSGGEPLLNFEIIRYTIEKSKALLRGSDKKFIVFLVTNGTIYDDEILKYLNDNNVNIGISIDGDSRVHDQNRYYADKSGSYEKVSSTITTIKQSKNLSSHTRDIWGLSVITGESAQLPEIIKHNLGLGINHMQMELVRISKDIDFSINNTNVDKLILEYKNLTDYFLVEINQGSFEKLKVILNDNDYFGKILCRVIDGGRVYYRCLAGIGKINFDAQGNIYPCEFFVGNSDYCIGNLEKGMDEDMVRCFYKENVEIRNKCKDCWARYLCGGDCYTNSLLVNGDIYTPDDCFCRLNKKFIEYALIIMISLKQKGILKECANFLRMRKVLSATGGNCCEK